MLDTWTLTALLAAGMLASLISIRAGVTVAVIEMALGMILGTALGLKSLEHQWWLFLASFASVTLTFMAGSETDLGAMRSNLMKTILFGLISFLSPFMGGLLFSHLVLGWDLSASLIVGVALSSTSVAIVYVVLVEGGLAHTDVGKFILSGCFFTGLATLSALSLLFISASFMLLLFLAAMVTAALFLPIVLRELHARIRGRSGDIEVKAILLSVFLLAAMGELVGVQAVLPAYILGLISSSTLSQMRDAVGKLKSITLVFLNPFFFLGAGSNVSLLAMASGVMIIVALFLVKVGFKFIGVYPLAKRYVGTSAPFVTLLMATGLTFGTIAAQSGLSYGLLTIDQYSILIAAILMSAIIPTLLASHWLPSKKKINSEGTATVDR
ncbi:MAG: cation:proton antiporter [Methanomassiliicoccales archaeon]